MIREEILTDSGVCSPWWHHHVLWVQEVEGRRLLLSVYLLLDNNILVVRSGAVEEVRLNSGVFSIAVDGWLDGAFKIVSFSVIFALHASTYFNITTLT